MERQVRAWDFSGVIADISPWRSYFKQTYKELHDAWVPLTKGELTDDQKRLKAELKPKVLELLEDATNNLRYEQKLNPNAKEALEESLDNGYENIFLTTVPLSSINSASELMGINKLIKGAITIDILSAYYKKEKLMKDNAECFSLAEDYLLYVLKIGPIHSFADDTPGVINAASKAVYNSSKPLLYLYDKSVEGIIDKQDFKIVGDLKDIK